MTLTNSQLSPSMYCQETPGSMLALQLSSRTAANGRLSRDPCDAEEMFGRTSIFGNAPWVPVPVWRSRAGKVGAGQLAGSNRWVQRLGAPDPEPCLGKPAAMDAPWGVAPSSAKYRDRQSIAEWPMTGKELEWNISNVGLSASTGVRRSTRPM